MPHPLIQRALALLQPDPTEPPPVVRFVPVPLLFIHTEPLPEGMQPSEWQGFADVTMEGLSPMPLEQLSWGFLSHEKSPNLIIFAAARDRLEREDLAPDGSFVHVLPSFFAAAPVDGTAQWVFLWEAGHVVALHYDAETPVPSRIELEPVIEDTPAGAFAARDRLVKRLGSAARTEAAATLLTRPEAVRAARDRLQFTFTVYTSPEVEPVRTPARPPADSSSFWTADLRDQAFRESEQQRRRTMRIMTRTLQAAGAFAIVLLVLQFVWAGVSIWLKTAESRVARQEPTVDKITQDNELVLKIDQFSAHQLRPFEMLGIINELRPPTVVFKSAKATGDDQVEAQCIASDVPSMNDFVDAINKSRIAVVNPNTGTVMGPRGVTFNLAVKFNQPPAAEPMPADKPPEPPANPNPGPPGFMGRPPGVIGAEGPSPVIPPAENPAPGNEPNQPPEATAQTQPQVYINN